MSQSLYTSQIWQQMVSGRPYQTQAKPLKRARQQAKRWCAKLNNAANHIERQLVLQQLLPYAQDASLGRGFYCDYGVNIVAGPELQVGNNVVILDAAPITLGASVKISDGVVIASVQHAKDSLQRRSGWQHTRPIVIGANVTIEQGVTILQGARIESGAVIAAGQVVVAT